MDLEDMAAITLMRPPGTQRKMELHCMVHRLLALEEKRVLTVRPAQQAIPHKVTLPPFWEKDAAAWFRLAEVIMEDNHVRDPLVRYRTLLLHILHHLLERARGS